MYDLVYSESNPYYEDKTTSLMRSTNLNEIIAVVEKYEIPLRPQEDFYKMSDGFYLIEIPEVTLKEDLLKEMPKIYREKQQEYEKATPICEFSDKDLLFMNAPSTRDY